MNTSIAKRTNLSATKYPYLGSKIAWLGTRAKSKNHTHPYLRSDFLEVHPELIPLAEKIAAK